MYSYEELIKKLLPLEFKFNRYYKHAFYFSAEKNKIEISASYYGDIYRYEVNRDDVIVIEKFEDFKKHFNDISSYILGKEDYINFDDMT